MRTRAGARRADDFDVDLESAMASGEPDQEAVRALADTEPVVTGADSVRQLVADPDRARAPVTAGQRESYDVSLTRTGRRHLSESLPLDVAIGASEFITGPLADNPHRVGKELDAPLKGIRSARLMQNRRILYVVPEVAHTVLVGAILRRRDAYHPAM